MSAQEVSIYLRTLPRIVSAKPVEVTFNPDSKKPKVFVGSLYAQRHTYQSTERAVIEGLANAGEDYLKHSFYLLGQKPKFQRANVCFTWENDLPLDNRVYKHSNEWYTAGYIEHIKPEFAQYHPFGVNFMLNEWPCHLHGYYKDHKIDTLERYVYLRVPMSVKYLD